MRKIAAFALAILAVACQRPMTGSDYVAWLYRNMPLPDSLSFDRAYWEANTAKTLEVRDRMAWNVPEREFRHFVLPVRVNNEDLDDFRTIYADTLCARVAGMSMADAAIEINHWCHEQATYRPSDARTSSPIATIRFGLGRCGEESVLAVAALRAAGIPARQVYTPRWAHTDDNHAWVEVWVDGQWYFMGACEPEPRLNMAWFNAPVSRAMLLHTKVFGDYQGSEDVIRKTACYTEINVIRGYVPARRSVVTILDTDGKPVEGADVEFGIYNYAEFFPVARYHSDNRGQASLDMGKGDMFVWASKDDKFGFGKVSGETAEVVLEHRIGERFCADLTVVPPVEDPIRTGATDEEIAANAARLEVEDAIRAAHDHSNPELDAFLVSGAPECALLVSQLSGKDRNDVTRDVLEDVICNMTSEDPYILCHRVANEFLYPVRGEILASGIGERLACIEEVIAWTRDSIRIVEGRNPQLLSIPPRSVWRSRMSDERSRGIFFVALARTLGYPARIDEVTGKTQYRSADGWVDVKFGQEAPVTVPAKGSASLEYVGGLVRTPKYYRHFTISQIVDGRPYLLEYGTDADDTPLQLFADFSLDAGYYMLTSGTRLADGSVLAHIEFFPMEADAKAQIPLMLPQDATQIAVIGSMDAEQLFLKDGEAQEQSLLSATGRGYFLVAVMGDKDEPSSHARIELETAADVLNDWGRPAVVLGASRPSGLDNAIFGTDPARKVYNMLADGCESSGATLPLIAVCDSFGRIVYFSQGYNTSLASDLTRVIAGL